MQGRPILYNGLPINKDHFRVYIYQAGGIKKLVNSYDDYERHLSTGLWFSSVEDIPLPVKAKQQVNKKTKVNPDIEETKIEKINDSFEDAAKELKRDGFLDNIEGA